MRIIQKCTVTSRGGVRYNLTPHRAGLNATQRKRAPQPRILADIVEALSTLRVASVVRKSMYPGGVLQRKVRGMKKCWCRSYTVCELSECNVQLEGFSVVERKAECWVDLIINRYRTPLKEGHIGMQKLGLKLEESVNTVHLPEHVLVRRSQKSSRSQAMI